MLRALAGDLNSTSFEFQEITLDWCFIKMRWQNWTFEPSKRLFRDVVESSAEER